MISGFASTLEWRKLKSDRGQPSKPSYVNLVSLRQNLAFQNQGSMKAEILGFHVREPGPGKSFNPCIKSELFLNNQGQDQSCFWKSRSEIGRNLNS